MPTAHFPRLARSITTTRPRRATMPTLPPAPRPPNWKACAPTPNPHTGTFAATPRLPRLPVPPLRATLEKLAVSLAPLARDPAELAAARAKIAEFGRAGGAGERLQARLEARRAEARRVSWLEEWWDDLAYLGYRDSVVVNVSYFYGFHREAHKGQDPVQRAAALTRAALLFRRALYRSEIPQEGTKDAPFCMDSFRWMFDCCRVPGTEGLDWSVTHARPEEEGLTGHIVVLRGGRFWELQAAQDGRILSTAELHAQLDHIIKESDAAGPGEGIGVLTASNRDTWAQDMQHLLAAPANAANLRTLHSAAFVLCLDAAAPSSTAEFSRLLWHGAHGAGALGLRNRWVDKPVQLVVCDNGAAGIMGEHSVMDGTPTVTLCDWMLTRLADPAFDHGAPAPGGVAGPRELRWDVDAQTRQAVARAESEARALVEGQTLSVARTAYGKAAVKACGVSPDAWAQLVVQLAYARLRYARDAAHWRERPGGTYEAATARRFARGRTEVIRVVSAESEAFVEGMVEGAPRAEQRARFEKAVETHVRLAREAGAGQGVDRHMLGLKLSLQPGEPAPAVFDDALVKRASYWVLSTSAVFSRHFEAYGWGEVVPDGFGVAYMTGFDDYLQFTITSRKEMPNAEFVQEILRAADDVLALYDGPKAKL